MFFAACDVTSPVIIARSSVIQRTDVPDTMIFGAADSIDRSSGIALRLTIPYQNKAGDCALGRAGFGVANEHFF